MKKTKKRGLQVLLGTLLIIVLAITGCTAQENPGSLLSGASVHPAVTPVTRPATKFASQVNVHIGQTGDTVSLTYAWPDGTAPQVTVTASDGSKKTVPSTPVTADASGKYRFTAVLGGLSIGTDYTYNIGGGGFLGSFTTPQDSGPFTFAFLADTQIKSAPDARSAGAVFKQLNELEDLAFLYLAGDLTNVSDDEEQWELLFRSGGAFDKEGQNLFGSHLIAAAQGNHDDSAFSGHISAPMAGADKGAACYGFSYSNIQFVVLNLNNVETWDAQAAFLKEQTEQAKANGQWVFVGFHQSLYSGASHITDDTLVAARSYWSPLLAGLGVDVVLQGHDHVYARGFVTAQGANAGLKSTKDGYTATPGAPLYVTGGESGAAKWYSAVNYTVLKGDPLTPGYQFLDINSAVPSQNPWNTDTGKTKEQSYILISVNGDELRFETYMMKYDGENNTMAVAPYLYDSLVLHR